MIRINAMTKGLRSTLRNRRYRERHPGRHSESQRKWRAVNLKKAREVSRRSARKRYEANLPKGREKSRKWRAANPDKARESNRESSRKQRAANPDKFRAQRRKRYAANPEKSNESSRKRYEANRDRACENVRRWNKANPEKIRVFSHKRRARKKGNGGTWTEPEWLTLLRQLQFRCVGCWKNDIELAFLNRELVPDHIVPLSKGGTNDITNLQPLCHGVGGCNNKKSAKYCDFLVAY